jgi:ABC-2 type transport system ATP-binding protein
MAKSPIISVEHLQMNFGTKEVIRDLSFSVQTGETFGFLGSNGSGKTTVLRILLGIYQPTGGKALINGKKFQPEDGAHLGYLPEERGLYRKEPVIDVMIYFGRLKGLSESAARRWSIEYLQRVGLGGQLTSQIDKLSGGQQQKVQLGITIMNQPQLLILDEPTKGFDPVNRRLLTELIDEQRQAGATIMMVTHQMEEVERICDHILLLKNGTTAAYGTIAEVKKQFNSKPIIELHYSGQLPASPLYSIRQQTVNYAELTPTKTGTESEILSDLVRKNLTISEYSIRQTSLDDIFVQIYGTDTISRGEA